MTTRAVIERLESLVESATPQEQARGEIATLDLILTQVDPATRARIEELTTLNARAKSMPPSGVNASGAPRTKRWLCVASGDITNNATGAPLVNRWLCVASGQTTIRAGGAPMTKRWTCAASGSTSIHATGAPMTKRWTCAASGQITVRAVGAPNTKKWTCIASGTVTPVFDPATLNLTGWWREYPGKPAMDGGAHWVGTASAGSSAAHDLTPAASATNNPPTGTPLNGHVTAQFNSVTASRLNEPTSNAVLFAAAAGSAWFLVHPDVAAAHTATPYQNGNLLTDGGNAETDFCFTTLGAGLVLFSGGVYNEVTTPCGIGAYHLLQFKWDGVNIKVRVDSGAWVSTACGPWSVTAPGAMQLGFSFADVRRYDGALAELATSATVISDADFDNVKSYINARYGLAL